MAGPAGSKAYAATLIVGLVIMIAGFAAELLIHASLPSTPATPVPQTAAAGSSDILPLISHADVPHGQVLAGRQCGSCHSFTPGGGAVVGPDLYGVLGARVAAADGYPYSTALKGAGGRWTYERLDRWLLDPQAVAPGTLMSYPGMPDIHSRADVIAYLRTLSEHPLALPSSRSNP